MLPGTIATILGALLIFYLVFSRKVRTLICNPDEGTCTLVKSSPFGKKVQTWTIEVIKEKLNLSDRLKIATFDQSEPELLRFIHGLELLYCFRQSNGSIYTKIQIRQKWGTGYLILVSFLLTLVYVKAVVFLLGAILTALGIFIIDFPFSKDMGKKMLKCDRNLGICEITEFGFLETNFIRFNVQALQEARISTRQTRSGLIFYGILLYCNNFDYHIVESTINTLGPFSIWMEMNNQRIKKINKFINEKEPNLLVEINPDLIKFFMLTIPLSFILVGVLTMINNDIGYYSCICTLKKL
jgi:hypothetical protein